jgi:hypothetical protein
MIQRLRNRQRFATPIQEQIENPPTIAEELLKALHHWDVLSIVKYDRYAYEEIVVGLIRYLEPSSTCDDIEAFVFQVLLKYKGSSEPAPADVRRIQALAGDIWHAWSQYLQRRGQVAIMELHARARMRRFLLPQ